MKAIANSPIQGTIEQFEMQTRIFTQAFDGLDKEALNKRPNENTNSIIWIAGHVTAFRGVLANDLGGKVEDPFNGLFFQGIEDRFYAPIDQVVKHWETASEVMVEKLKSQDEDALLKEMPNKPCSFKDFITFLAYHEAYHIGQIGILRKILGFEAMQSY